MRQSDTPKGLCALGQTYRPLSRRSFLKGSAAVAAGAAAAGLVAPRRSFAGEEINVLAWCDNADAKLIEPFQQQSGAKVNIKTYEGTGSALAILEQSAPGDWDVFIVDAQDVPRVGRMGILEDLTDFDVPSWNDFFPEIVEQPYLDVDGKRYAIPQKFGYYGVAYNKEKVDPADMRKASVMWNEKYKGRMACYDYYFPAIQLIGISEGLRPDQITVDNLPQLRQKLLEMKPMLALVGDIVSVQNALVTGSVDLIVNAAEFAVSGLTSTNPALEWVIFDEGGLLWNQGMAIFEDSRKKELAGEFIKYVVGPAGQAALATSECYWAMPVNEKAELNDEEKKILRWDEQPDFLSRSYPSTIASEELDKSMLDAWTEFLQA